jgi:hypothetical protein
MITMARHKKSHPKPRYIPIDTRMPIPRGVYYVDSNGIIKRKPKK